MTVIETLRAMSHPFQLRRDPAIAFRGGIFPLVERKRSTVIPSALRFRQPPRLFASAPPVWRVWVENRASCHERPVQIPSAGI